MDKLTVCIIKETGKDIGTGIGTIIAVVALFAIGIGALMATVYGGVWLCGELSGTFAFLKPIAVGLLTITLVVLEGAIVLMFIAFVVGLPLALIIGWQRGIRERCISRYEATKPPAPLQIDERKFGGYASYNEFLGEQSRRMN